MVVAHRPRSTGRRISTMAATRTRECKTTNDGAWPRAYSGWRRAWARRAITGRPGRPLARKRKQQRMTARVGGPCRWASRRRERQDVRVVQGALGTVVRQASVVVRARVDGQLQQACCSTKARWSRRARCSRRSTRARSRCSSTQAEGQLGARPGAAARTRRLDLAALPGAARAGLDREAAGRHAGRAGAQYEGTVQGGPGQSSTTRGCSSPTRTSRRRSPGRIGLRQVDAGNIVHASDANGLVRDHRRCSRSPCSSPCRRTACPRSPRMRTLQRQGTRAGGRGVGPRQHAASSRSGRLLTIDNQIDPTTGTVKLKAQFANADGALFPNQFVNVRMLVDDAGATRSVDAQRRRSSAARRATFVYVVEGRQHGRRVRARQARPGRGRAARSIDGRPRTRASGRRDRRRRPPARRRAGSIAGARPARPGRRGNEGSRDRFARRSGERAGTRRGVSGMNPSRPFILRPVATSLLMVAILLAGLVAYRLLPLSALPRSTTRRSRSDALSGREPRGDDVVGHGAARAPVRPDAGPRRRCRRRAPAAPRSSRCSSTLDLTSTSPSRKCRRRSTPAGNLLPADLPAPPVYSKVNPADAPILTLALTSTTLPLPQVQDLVDTRAGAEDLAAAGRRPGELTGGQRPAVRIQANPTRAGRVRPRASTTCAPRSPPPTSTRPRAASTGPTRAYTIDANDQLHVAPTNTSS